MASPLTVIIEALALGAAAVLGAIGHRVARWVRGPPPARPPIATVASLRPRTLPISRPVTTSVLPRVLVIDDEASFAKLIRRILMHADHGLLVEADIAHTAAEALDLARAHAYRVIIVDLDLPGMGGAALLPQLRARTLVYSGAVEEVLEVVRRDGGADAVLAKDAGEAALVEAVRALL